MVTSPAPPLPIPEQKERGEGWKGPRDSDAGACGWPEPAGVAGTRCGARVPGDGEQVREQAAGLPGSGARWDQTDREGAMRRAALEVVSARKPSGIGSWGSGSPRSQLGGTAADSAWAQSLEPSGCGESGGCSRAAVSVHGPEPLVRLCALLGLSRCRRK